jgi:uncharacterized protein involved in exopolysaccharide biosynthesis
MYRQTIRRYPRVLAMPIVFCAIMALWVVAGSPKQYESGASLWVDHAAPAPSSLTQTDSFVQTTPADQELQIINELLTTRDFRLAVAQRGPLGRYLSSNPSAGWGPGVLLSSLRGASPLDQQVLAELGPKRLTLEAKGPQVLHIAYQSGSPTVAAGTVKALVEEVNARLATFAAQRSRTTITVAQGAVAAASKSVVQARQRIDAYRAGNPGANSGDAQFVALLKAERAAARDLNGTTARLNEVSSGKAAAAAATSFTLIDAPRAPIAPVSGKKSLVMAIFGGLFAGGLISALILITLTPSRPQAPELREVGAVRELDPRFGAEPANAGADGR